MEIYNVPDQRRYWVVRAESGHYFSHFIKNGIIALGHLNCLNLADSKVGDPPFDWEKVKTKYHQHKEAEQKKNGIEKEARRTNYSQLNQAFAFTSSMQVGDWVVTVGEGVVRFGRVIGLPYIRKAPLTIVYDEEKDHKITMDMHLRRKVEWGPSISRDQLPYGLLISLKANQTVFCLDSKWEAIYHSLYPAFQRGDKLYLSAKIKTQNKIKNHNMAQLFRLLDEIEIIGKEFAANKSIKDFDNTYSEYIKRDALTVTTKAQFHSPGEIWNAITAAPESMAYVVTAYAMIFGNHKLGFDGILDLDTRHKIRDFVLERLKKNNAENVVKNLNLDTPETDNTKLEDQSKDRTEIQQDE